MVHIDLITFSQCAWLLQSDLAAAYEACVELHVYKGEKKRVYAQYGS